MKWHWWIGAGLIAVTAPACTGSDVPEAGGDASAKPVTVVAATPVAADVADRLEAGGVAAAATSAVITSRVVAPVLELRARAGDRVRAGQVLVVLDDRDLAAVARQTRASIAAADQGLSAARSDLAAATADQTLATAWQGRIATLQGKNSATAQELDEANARLSSAAARVKGAESRVEQATAQVAAARAAAEAAETTHTFATVRAPFDGLVTETLADPGNLASPGVPLLRLESVGSPRVEATVDEARVAYVKPGDRVEVLFEASEPVEGVVSEVSRAVRADERTFTVKVSLPRGTDVRSGTFARVRFDGPVRRALLVPATAVRKQGQIATVFVVERNVARLRLIQTGREIGDRIEVLAGLDPQERIVTAPPANLADGREVVLQPGAPPAGDAR